VIAFLQNGMEHFTEFLISLGYIGLFSVVFAESGLLIGFFLPGDSLLFSAGLIAAEGTLNIVWVIIGCTVAAIAGDSVGYAFGRRVGPRLFQREDSRFFTSDAWNRPTPSTQNTAARR
jgi:membrane-associated protein